MKRKVSSLTFVYSPVKRAYINLTGCNFDCKACFAVAKKPVGKSFSVEELLNFFIKACKFIMGEIANEVVLTGGEPTVNPKYLFDLIKGLKELGINKIELSTNGYLLSQDNLVRQLKANGINLVKTDLKAYDDAIHKWYTGKSNLNCLRAIKLLYDSNLNFLVRTIFIPDIVDIEEIEKIALFLASIDKNIPYRIYQFVPGKTGISRKPRKEEMLAALNTAKQYLNDVEILIDVSSYRKDWASVEVCADNLAETFKEIAEASARVIESWREKYKVIKMSDIPANEVI